MKWTWPNGAVFDVQPFGETKAAEMTEGKHGRFSVLHPEREDWPFGTYISVNVLGPLPPGGGPRGSRARVVPVAELNPCPASVALQPLAAAVEKA